MRQVYQTVFGQLKELGFTKLFEDMSMEFFMQIATSPRYPITASTTKEEILKMDESILPSWYKDYLTKEDVFRESDDIRYHIFKLGGVIAGVYFVILNDKLEGRSDGNGGLIGDHPGITKFTSYPKDADPAPMFLMNSIILFGDKAPQVTDVTRGLILKHELAHTILSYVTNVVHPDFFKEKISELNTSDPKLAVEFEKTMTDFIEFLCDFVQYDASIVTKYIKKPLQKFCDAELTAFTKATIEKYRPFVEAVDWYYHDLEQTELMPENEETSSGIFD